MDKKLLVIIGIIIVITISFSNKKEAILPIGEYNVDSECIWATNVDPQDSRYTSYGNSGAWISLDVNGDGIWEKYGYIASTSNVPNLPIIIENYNSYGDDISYKASDLRIYVYSGYNGKVLEENYGAASNAIIPSCATTTTTIPSTTTTTIPSGTCWTFNEMIQNLNDNWVNC